MKLHWSPRSPYVRKVDIVAHETGLSELIERVRSPVFMTAMNPEVMQDSPLNKIPVLVLEDGHALYDSLVICLYLDSRHTGAKLAPQDGAGWWRLLQQHALGNGLLDLLILWRNVRDRPEQSRSRKHLDAFAAKTAAVLDGLEERPPPPCSETFDLAAITFGCALGYLDFRFADLEWRNHYPRLAAWEAEFAARPSARATMPHE
jgi:glutathione S-transferase